MDILRFIMKNMNKKFYNTYGECMICEYNSRKEKEYHCKHIVGCWKNGDPNNKGKYND